VPSLRYFLQLEPSGLYYYLSLVVAVIVPCPFYTSFLSSPPAGRYENYKRGRGGVVKASNCLIKNLYEIKTMAYEKIYTK